MYAVASIAHVIAYCSMSSSHNSVEELVAFSCRSVLVSAALVVLPLKLEMLPVKGKVEWCEVVAIELFRDMYAAVPAW